MRVDRHANHNGAPRHLKRTEASRRPRGILWLVAMISALAMVIPGMTPASYAEGASSGQSAQGQAQTKASDRQFLTITKSVDSEESKVLQPGQSFTYQISVTCSEQNCVNATMQDALPEELNGFQLVGVDMTPSSVNAQASWTQGGQAVEQPTTVGSDTVLNVALNQSFSGGTGLGVGTTAHINVTLQVPADFSPDDARNGTTITNTATSSADNSLPDSDSADVSVKVKEEIRASIQKMWTPDSASFDPGKSSTIALTSTNTSNVTVDKMTVQEPQASAAADGAGALDANNPFRISDFAGFGTAQMPAGADTVQVDAYVLKDGSWTWVTGSPASAYTLPSGVTKEDVGGLRFTYVGTMAPDAADSVELNLTQRTYDRNDKSDLSTLTSTVHNVAQVQTFKGDTSSAVATDDANYELKPVSLATTVDKSISPMRVPAGNTATGKITATNTASPVKTLTVSDAEGFFTNGTTFTGFTEPITYPAGASKGTVIFHIAGGDSKEVSFASGDTPPAASGADVTGFDIVFSSDSNSIEPKASSTITFGIATSSDVDFGSAKELTTTNTATSKVVAANGNSATASDGANLTIVKPSIVVTLKKTVMPSDNVEPGQSVIASLVSTTSALSDYVQPTKIVVEDSWNKDEDGFWNAFDLKAIQPTQVPAGASMTIEVQVADGSWKELDSTAAQTDAHLYQLSASDLTSKLSAQGIEVSAVQGIRFTFEKPASDPFPAKTNVNPYISYTARDTTRTKHNTDTVDGAEDPNTGKYPEQVSTKYKNTATTTGTGKTDDGKELVGSDTDDATTGVIVYPGGITGVNIDKTWEQDSVSSLSGASATTDLNWRVGEGKTSVTITDPAGDLDDVSTTVFDAFNLTKVQGVAVSNTPYTTGWALKYDSITSLELYNGSDWVKIPAPNGSWQNGDGSFKGYALTSDEVASTQGVRLHLEPNDTARQAALSSGHDPYAPAVGSGVTATSAERTVKLDWQVRDKKRSDGEFVTQETEYNTSDRGTVNNVVGIVATAQDGSSSDEANDTIVITDQPPAVKVVKTTANQTIQVPAPGTDQAEYPTNSYTLTAKNQSTTRATYVRVTDPTVCTDTALDACTSELSADGTTTAEGAVANPFESNVDVINGRLDTNPGTPNPFNRQNLTKVTIAASQADQVDLSKSTVWLLKFTPKDDESGTGNYSYVRSDAAHVNAMSAADLADVVGISVTFQGTDPGTTGGTIAQNNNLTIKLDTQVRATLRTTGDAFIPSTQDLQQSNNRVFAQSYDTITGKDKSTGAVSGADVNFTTGTIDVNPGKSISSGNITVVNPKAPQTVTLTADQGNSSVSPTSVVITDEPDGADGSTDFWKNFDFTGLEGIVFPTGSDQVQISAYGPFGEGGAMGWVDGTAQASTAASFVLPVDASRYSDIEGLKFTFSRSDGKTFSPGTPPTTAKWQTRISYTAVLRDKERGSDNDVAFPGTATDKVSAQSISQVIKSDKKSATADVSWTSGTAKLAIDKLANEGTRSAQVGSMVPWDITIKNTGTGYLDLTEVVDTLPSSLRYTGAGSPSDPTHPVQFTPDATEGSTLTTTPTVDSSDPDKLVFTWPDGQSRLQPGETAVIRVWLELQPGLKSGEKATNTVSVQTKQKLDAVSDAKPNNGAGDVTKNTDGTNGATTSDYVSPTDGENVYVIKGVKGALSGAINTSDPTQNCNATLKGLNDQDYYRTPCAANSTVNGTDQWILHMVNAGTTDVKRVQFFDQLPVQDDKYLIANDVTRGSEFRPEILDDLEALGAPEGTSVKIEATTDTNACVGTWDTLGTKTNPITTSTDACTANTWVDKASVSDWSKVTGIRVTLDFQTSTAGVLKPGEGVDITYSSRNVVQSSADSSGASADIPATDQFAWNQFGLLYTGNRSDKIAPSVVGTHLRTGSIQVTKETTGGAAAYAPATVTATLACDIPAKNGLDKVDLTFDGEKTKQVTLTKNEDGTYGAQRISGIPVGAECSVTEDGEAGHFGETSRTPEGSTTLPVSQADSYASGTEDAGDPTNDVPSAQVATLSNDYQWSELSITKKVDTKANAGTFGPFSFSLTCTTSDGQTVTFGGAASTTFTLEGGKTWTAPKNTIPARSTCILTETDSSHADSTVYTGDNVTSREDGSATIEIGQNSTQVISTLVTNRYDAGTFTVTKKADGSGADTYGTGSFTFQSVCTYQGQELLDQTYTLERNGKKTFGIFPAGTECATTELKTSGATSTSMNPSDGKVTIAKQADASTVSSVDLTVTNTFDSGALKVTKKVDGAGAEKFGAGPFTAKVVCTYDKDGEESPVTLANGGMVELSSANGYSATLTGIIAGAQCSVTETGTAGADESTLDPTDGTVTVGGSTDDPVEVVITNTFEAGYVTVEKKVEGDGADAYGSGPFSFQAVCSWPEGTGTQGAGGSETTDFTLTRGQSKQLGLYPVGTSCQVSETDPAAATSTSWNPATQEVTVNTSGDASKPSDAVVIATNTFDVASLTVKKAMSGAGAEDYGVGPFTAKVACTYQKSGQTVDVDLPDEGVLTLSADNGYTATIDGILKGASCTVEETDLGGADSNAITGDGVSVDEGGVATLVVGADEADSAEVTITNTFEAGYVTVSKVVDGAGADAYGDGEFTFTSVCTIPEGKGIAGKGGTDTQEFTLKGGESKQLGLYPMGTECQVTENTSGGATSTSITPEGGVATVVASEDPETASNVAVTATNTFDVGSVKITKKRTGIGVAEFGDGPFEAQVACTYLKDGETTEVDLPKDGKVTLSKDNGYVATVDGIIAGAECTVTETKDGGADKTSLSPSDGAVTVGNAAEGDPAVEVTITNEFNTVTPPKSGKLPVTGAPLDYLVLAAGSFLLLGGVLVIRRRRSERHGAHVRR